MKRATIALILGGLLIALSANAVAAIPEGKVAVIRATRVNGIASHEGPVKVEREAVVSYDGRQYAFPAWVVASLGDTKTILVVNDRQDTVVDGVLIKKHTQKVQLFDASMFTVQVNPDTQVTYQVASVAGNLRLLGDEGHIACQGGTDGPYQIWRIDDLDLVDVRSIQALDVSDAQ